MVEPLPFSEVTSTLLNGDYATWLGTFGEAWFRALCVAAGCTPARPSPDVLGTDFLVQDKAGEVIRVQVKTTEHPTVVNQTFRFDLDVAVYDRLRRVTGTKAYLCLVVVRAPHPRWTGHCRLGSVVRASAFVLEVSNMPVTNNRAKVRLSLPFGSMISPVGIQGMFV